MPASVSQSDVARVALGLLARREYTRKQLTQKLQRRFSEPDQQGWIEAVLEDFINRGYLSDARYLEIALRQHLEQGHGPLRIQAALREKGLAEADITAALEALEVDWSVQAAETRHRRFKELPTDQKEKARQLRFLQYRGFTMAQCLSAMKALADDSSNLP